MTDVLDIHLATDEERRAAHANCHDIWSLGLSLDDHVLRRERSALHQRARWIVGCLEGRVVAALASHPLRFRLHGRSLPGMGIASVHTLHAFRGQGLAQRLIRWIESFEQQRGARLSVLFCDIEPRYYQRLGYLLCPAHCGWASATATAARSTDMAWNLLPRAKDEDFATLLPTLIEVYDSDHGRRALAIERSADYWRHLAARRPEAELFWLVKPRGGRDGFVSLRSERQDLLIDDHAVRGGDERTRAALFRTVIQVAGQRGFSRVGGWLPDSPPASGLFKLTARRDEITMFKPLDEGITVDPPAISAADWLQEVDHV